MTTQQKINKSAFVRNVLNEIGAISNTPPEGWKNKVLEALKNQNLEMHQTTIYQIRQKALKEPAQPALSAVRGRPKGSKNKALAIAANDAKVAEATKPAKATKAKPAKAKTNVNGSYSETIIADLQAVQQFAKKFGGLDGLSKVIDTINTLVNN